MVDEQQQAIQVFNISQQNSAQAGAQELASQQGIQVVNSGAAQSNGLPAYYVVADAQTDQGQLRLLSYYIEHRGNVYNFLGYTARDNFSQYENIFLRSMRGFADVTDPQILNAQPARIDIVSAPRSASLDTFVPSQLPGDLTPQDVAIMNQAELNQQITSGSLLKIPAAAR
jgi:predicted Zn-dependent protease